MKNYLKTIALISFSLFFFPQLHAQETNREIGVRMTNLNDFGVIYKKQRKEDAYLRLRIAFLNSSFQFESNNIDTGLGFSMGWEKRKAINENFEFIHGFEPSIRANYMNESEINTYRGSVALGYVLGLQYHISPQFYVGLETIPSLRSSFTFDDQGTNYPANIELGFNANAAALKLVYKFNRAK
jgi:hypothetical protein